MATIEDVAVKAGVSVATVSRVLNDSNKVSRDKKDKVMKAVKDLNYQPNALGRNLRRSETRMVLVVCTFVINEVLAGIQDTADDLGYDVILVSTGMKKRGLDAVKFIKNGMVDGVIFLNMIYEHKELIDLISQYPIVQSCEYLNIPNSYLVSVNDEKAAYEMTCHLIAQGRKRIAFLGYSTSKYSPNFVFDREKGYKRALAEHGLIYDSNLHLEGDLAFHGGHSGVEAAKKILAMENRPDAIFCIQDNMAIGCINTLVKAGVSVPGEIAVAGFDDIEMAQICDPQLTTVSQPLYDIGTETMKMLIAQIRGEIKTPRHIFLEHKLVIRGSTVSQP